MDGWLLRMAARPRRGRAEAGCCGRLPDLGEAWSRLGVAGLGEVGLETSQAGLGRDPLNPWLAPVLHLLPPLPHFEPNLPHGAPNLLHPSPHHGTTSPSRIPSDLTALLWIFNLIQEISPLGFVGGVPTIVGSWKLLVLLMSISKHGGQPGLMGRGSPW